MPDKYAIRYLPIAVDDRLSIYDWIADDSPERDISFIEKLDKRISSLTTHSFLGHIPKHEKLRTLGYRVLVIESYLVFYVVRGQIMEIARVLHAFRHIDAIV